MSITPTPADIEALAQQHLKAFAQFSSGEVWFEGEVEFARAVLAKWGTQPQAGAVPQGWKAVPVNPTPEMWKAAPQPSPAPLSDDAKDAARYRLLRRGRHWSVIDGIGNDLLRAEALDAAVDAVLAAQGGKT